MWYAHTQKLAYNDVIKAGYEDSDASIFDLLAQASRVHMSEDRAMANIPQSYLMPVMFDKA